MSLKATQKMWWRQCSHGKTTRVEFGHLVADAKMLWNKFDDWEINFVGRQANFAAHHLAKLAAWMGIKRQWLREISGCISETIREKQSVIPCWLINREVNVSLKKKLKKEKGLVSFTWFLFLFFIYRGIMDIFTLIDDLAI